MGSGTLTSSDLPRELDHLVGQGFPGAARTARTILDRGSTS